MICGGMVKVGCIIGRAGEPALAIGWLGLILAFGPAGLAFAAAVALGAIALAPVAAVTGGLTCAGGLGDEAAEETAGDDPAA